MERKERVNGWMCRKKYGDTHRMRKATSNRLKKPCSRNPSTTSLSPSQLKASVPLDLPVSILAVLAPN